MEAKIKEHIKSLGCNDYIKASLAYQLYLELSEVRAMFDIQFSFDKELDLIYLTAKPTKDSPSLVYVPYSTSLPISMQDIDRYQKMLCNDNSGDTSITLACIEGDSTVVLYSFTAGLVSVDNPDSLVRHKTREERKDFVECEIKRNRFEILAKAYENGVVDIE